MKDILDLDIFSQNILTYGAPGTYKSRAVIGYTEKYPGKILFVQTEPGMCSPMSDPAFRSSAIVKRPDSYDDVKILKYGVESWVNKTVNPQAKKFGLKEVDLSEVNLFVLDSITHLGEIVKQHVMKVNPPKNPHGIPEMKQWMMMAELIRQICQGIENSPLRCYLTGQHDLREEPASGGEEGAAIFLPDVPTKQRFRIMYDVDWVFYSFMMNGTPKIRTEHGTNSYAKSRGILLPKIMDFNLADMFGLIEDELAKQDKAFEIYQKDHPDA